MEVSGIKKLRIIKGKQVDKYSAVNMLKYFIQLENDHIVPKRTPGHGFNGILDISRNDDSNLKNQSQALVVLQATAEGLGEDPSNT
jgi:choline dehydrogenase